MSNDKSIVDKQGLCTFYDNIPIQNETINFFTGNPREPILKLCENGDIFVHGKKIENDIEVVEGMRDFLYSQGLCKGIAQTKEIK